MRAAARLALLREKLAKMDEYIVVTIAGGPGRAPIVIDYRTARYVDGYLVIPRQHRGLAPGSKIATRGKERTPRPRRRG